MRQSHTKQAALNYVIIETFAEISKAQYDKLLTCSIFSTKYSLNCFFLIDCLDMESKLWGAINQYNKFNETDKKAYDAKPNQRCKGKFLIIMVSHK